MPTQQVEDSTVLGTRSALQGFNAESACVSQQPLDQQAPETPPLPGINDLECRLGAARPGAHQPAKSHRRRRLTDAGEAVGQLVDDHDMVVISVSVRKGAHSSRTKPGHRGEIAPQATLRAELLEDGDDRRDVSSRERRHTDQPSVDDGALSAGRAARHDPLRLGMGERRAHKQRVCSGHGPPP